MADFGSLHQKSAFISYSRYNRDAALEIRKLLTENDVKVWLDVVDIRTSKALLEELFDNIDVQNVFCLLLSPTSVASVWVQEEIRHALKKPGLQVLPIIIQSCRIPEDLTNIVALDARQGLSQESVQSRLLRAVCGSEKVPDGILLTHIERELLAKKEIQELAATKLPKTVEFVNSISHESMKKIEVKFDFQSLPSDSATILELQVGLDIWNGAFSIFIAQYRENSTWPDPLRFEEPDYTDFYTIDKPRVDVYFRWSDYVQRMVQTVTDWEEYPMIFTLEFDGRNIRPGGRTQMPAKLEIPAVAKLMKIQSQVSLKKHMFDPNHATEEVERETDIRLELRGLIGDLSVCLYNSCTGYKEDAILESSFFRPDVSRIYQQIVLDQYLPDSSVRGHMEKAKNNLRTELLEALNTVETDWSQFVFESKDEHHLAARLRYARAGYRFRNHLFRDAYKMYADTGDLLYELRKTQKLSFRDNTMIFVSYLHSTSIFLRQEKYDDALMMQKVLESATADILATDANEPDYHRYRADAMAIGATASQKMNQMTLALAKLFSSIKIYTGLYEKLPSKARRQAWLQSLTNGVQSLQAWGLTDAPALTQWKSILREELGDALSNQLTSFRPPNQLPFWLQRSKIAGWSTTPISSHTLRYSMDLPAHWKPEFTNEGTNMETWHTYWGSTSQDADWLYISFMENADEGGDMKKWVNFPMLLANFLIVPPHDGGDERKPQRRTWNYIGTEPAFKEKMRADDTHCFIGTATYQRSYVMVGRMYVILVRRKKFAWKIVLSIMTACLDGISEEIIASNDHRRAGAVLGGLMLDGIGLGK